MSRVQLDGQLRASDPVGGAVVRPELARRAFGEFIGTALLLAAIVGSGAAAQHLSKDVGLQLFENAAATAAALVAIILAIGPVSGAHLNPVVTLATRALDGGRTADSALYIAAQFAGGACGAIIANLMFSLPAVELSTTIRGSGALWLSEVVATFGLVLVIFSLLRSGRASTVPVAVGAYIGGAYLFTSSTSFANPAATMARVLTNSFAGISAGSVPAFLAAQTIGAGLAVLVVKVLYPTTTVAQA